MSRQYSFLRRYASRVKIRMNINTLGAMLSAFSRDGSPTSGQKVGQIPHGLVEFLCCHAARRGDLQHVAGVIVPRCRVQLRARRHQVALGADLFLNALQCLQHIGHRHQRIDSIVDTPGALGIAIEALQVGVDPSPSRADAPRETDPVAAYRTSSRRPQPSSRCAWCH